MALVGDIVSFPSEAAIDWVMSQLTRQQVPYIYVAGNHDWHYEGMEGSLQQLRATWIERRLKPLYQGQNPLMSSHDVRGVRFLAVDNSNYEILPEQLDFFRTQVATGMPLVLFVHIPLFAGTIGWLWLWASRMGCEFGSKLRTGATATLACCGTHRHNARVSSPSVLRPESARYLCGSYSSAVHRRGERDPAVRDGGQCDRRLHDGDVFTCRIVMRWTR